MQYYSRSIDEAYQSINRSGLKIQNAERAACIADIKAAFWGDEYITDRYDIAEFILERIQKRGTA